MNSIGFVMKTGILTSLIVVGMQVRWGSSTIEEHALEFLTASSISKPVDETAHGAVVVIRNGWRKVLQMFDTNFSRSLDGENVPGQRDTQFQIRRSRQYIESKSEDLRDKAISGAGTLKQKWRHFIDETEVPEETRGSRQANREESGESSASNKE